MTTGIRNKLAAQRAQVKYRILEVLDSKGYDFSRVGRELGCTAANVSRVVNGHGHSARVLAKLREIGVPEAYLFDPEHKRKVA